MPVLAVQELTHSIFGLNEGIVASNDLDVVVLDTGKRN